MDLETRLVVPFMPFQLGVGLPSNGGSLEGRTLADVGLAYMGPPLSRFNEEKGRSRGGQFTDVGRRDVRYRSVLCGTLKIQPCFGRRRQDGRGRVWSGLQGAR